MAIFTLLDRRAEITGSRDPLGVQAVWTDLGRRIVGNLTTVSVSVVDFMTLLLGHWVVEQLRADEDEPRKDLYRFLRWEQLAAYTRVGINDEAGVRGIERVRQRLDAGVPLALSEAGEHQILGNQPTYGLWGIYTGPTRDSGLLVRREGATGDRLTSVGRSFVVEHLLPRLSKLMPRVLALVEGRRGKGSPLDFEKEKPWLQKLASVLDARELSDGARAFLHNHLLEGCAQQSSACRELQRDAVASMPESLLGQRLHVSGVERWVLQADKQSAELGEHLAVIVAAERLMAPATRVYSWLQHQADQRIGTIAEELRKHWGAARAKVNSPRLREQVLPVIERVRGSARVADQWQRWAEAFDDGDFATGLRALCEINRDLMSQRNGMDCTPWIEFRDDDRLKIHYREQAVNLGDARDLRELWVNSYFLDSLVRLKGELRA